MLLELFAPFVRNHTIIIRRSNKQRNKNSNYWLMSSQRSGPSLSATSSDLDKIQFNPKLSDSADSAITGRKDNLCYISFCSRKPFKPEPSTKSPLNLDAKVVPISNPEIQPNDRTETVHSRDCSEGCVYCRCCCCRLCGIRWEYTMCAK